MTEHESHKSHESSIVEHNIEESFEQCSRLEKACALNRVPDSELNMLAAALAGTGFEFASMCVFWAFLNSQRGIYNCSLKFPSHLARSGQRIRKSSKSASDDDSNGESSCVFWHSAARGEYFLRQLQWWGKMCNSMGWHMRTGGLLTIHGPSFVRPDLYRFMKRMKPPVSPGEGPLPKWSKSWKFHATFATSASTPSSFTATARCGICCGICCELTKWAFATTGTAEGFLADA